MLAIVVGLFAVLWLPYRVYVVYNSFARERLEDLWFLLFCRAMVYINSAVNPILYNVMSVKFRRAFRQLIACDGQRSEQPVRTPCRPTPHCNNSPHTPSTEVIDLSILRNAGQFS